MVQNSICNNYISKFGFFQVDNALLPKFNFLFINYKRSEDNKTKERGFKMKKKTDYQKFSDKKLPPSHLLKNMLNAFLIGGAICTLGEAIMQFYLWTGLSKDLSGSATSVTLIFLSVLFTGLGLYSKLAHYAGAGTIVPITGFANAVASPAIEAKTEGYVLGVCSKIFTIAGPVIVFGTAASAVAGVCFLIFG